MGLDSLSGTQQFWRGAVGHTPGTNLRFEPDEFNFPRERDRRGTRGAFGERDSRYAGEDGGAPGGDSSAPATGPAAKPVARRPPGPHHRLGHPQNRPHPRHPRLPFRAHPGSGQTSRRLRSAQSAGMSEVTR